MPAFTDEQVSGPQRFQVDHSVVGDLNQIVGIFRELWPNRNDWREALRKLKAETTPPAPVGPKPIKDGWQVTAVANVAAGKVVDAIAIDHMDGTIYRRTRRWVWVKSDSPEGRERKAEFDSIVAKLTAPRPGHTAEPSKMVPPANASPWTNEPPTEPGYYWYRIPIDIDRSKYHGPLVCEVRNSGVIYVSNCAGYSNKLGDAQKHWQWGPRIQFDAQAEATAPADPDLITISRAELERLAKIACDDGKAWVGDRDSPQITCTAEDLYRLILDHAAKPATADDIVDDNKMVEPAQAEAKLAEPETTKAAEPEPREPGVWVALDELTTLVSDMKDAPDCESAYGDMLARLYSLITRAKGGHT